MEATTVAFISLIAGPALTAVIVNHFSNRTIAKQKEEFESHQFYMKNLYDKDLKRIESELKLNESRLVSLHTKRLDMIESTYQNLIGLKKAMERFVSYNPSTNRKEFVAERKEIINDLSMSFKKYDDGLLLNKLYFNSAISSKLLTISDDYNNAFSDIYDFEYFLNSEEFDEDGIERLRKKKAQGTKMIINEIPVTIEKIEIEFHGILGVE